MPDTSAMPAKIPVLITVPFPEELVAEIRSLSPRLQVTLKPASKVDEIGKKLWKETEILYTGSVLPEPEWAPELHWIQFHYAGINRMIDAPILQKKGLVATTLSGANSAQVAEYLLMMLLALGHHLPALFRLQAEAIWPPDRFTTFAPQELSTSTVGIVGYGSIGRQLARLLSGFGTTVLAVKRDAMHPEDEGYYPQGQGDPEGDRVHRLYPPQALKAMLRECDFVVVAVPYTAQTHHLIGPKELEALKPKAYLIDISRGGVVDHDALIRALDERKIGGAALDVFPKEPLPQDSPLWNLPNVILTPHMAGATPDYNRRAISLFAENLTRYLTDLPLYNRIDLERGY